MPTSRPKTKFKAKPRSSAKPKSKPRRTPAAPATHRAASWPIRRAAGVQILKVPSLSRLTWLVHGFSTVSGGASALERTRDGKKSSERVLNLGFTDWDSRESVLANRKKFFAALGAPKMHIAALKQIHSDVIHVVGSKNFPSGDNALNGDALITRERGVLLTVQTADCIPILLADTKNRAIAAVHSGWRGTAQRIAEKTLGRMKMEYGTRAEDVLVAIGPGIGSCCYEVGHEVVKEFAAKFPDAKNWFTGPFDALADGDADSNWLPWLTMRPPGHAPPAPTVQLDLVAANRAILVNAGVPAKNISSSDLCTGCRPDLFFSYRKEKTTGRMMAAIGIKA
jgi:polyphenol oxidase